MILAHIHITAYYTDIYKQAINFTTLYFIKIKYYIQPEVMPPHNVI